MLALLITDTNLVMFDHSFLGSERKCIQLHFVGDYSGNKIKFVNEFFTA